jgi:glycosyltransferase involved in cell wall biosynthesis/UDP-2,3-diacylglucosamine pyrophosphatase LpxH
MAPLRPDIADLLEVAIAPGSVVVVASDLHLPPARTEVSARCCETLVRRLSEASTTTVVLAGDVLELLGFPGATAAEILRAHEDLSAALLAVTARGGQVVYAIGNHDGDLAWHVKAADTVREMTGARLCLAADLVLADGRKVRVEHGHQLDPYNSFHDARNALDTPLGHHIVREVIPRIESLGRGWIDGAHEMADPADFPSFVASRLVYRKLARHLWWLIAFPLAILILVRIPTIVGFRSRSAETNRWLHSGVILGYGAVVALVVVIVLVAILASRAWLSISALALAERGYGQNGAARQRAADLVADGYQGFVSGHTHHPELRGIGTGFYANSGSCTSVVEATGGRRGLPPAYLRTQQVCWVELDARGADLMSARVELPGATRLERFAARIGNPHAQTSGPVATWPVATWPDGSDWPSTDTTAKAPGSLATMPSALATAEAITPGGLSDGTAAGTGRRPDDEYSDAAAVTARIGEPLRGRRVAIVNWRDPWHPQAGGAERYAWEMARGLASRGARVGYLTARAPGQARDERRDGIDIVRRGGRLTVYPLVLAWMARHRKSFDAVLDCQNGIPFFTPLVLPRHVPVICVVHHVHDAQFGVHFPAPVAAVGRMLEGPASRWCYRRHRCVAVSRSTAVAMRSRLAWSGPIDIVPNGLSSDAFGGSPGEAAREPAGTVLTWVGRLVSHKRADRVLDIASRLAGSDVTIEVIGRGPGLARLAEKVAARDLARRVILRGYLSEEEKRRAVAGSRLHLNTSQGEGWGLCVLEAAALGVPTVAYDVDGLRDSICDGQTGWLVKDGDHIEDVTERALKELADPARRAEMAAACRSWARQFDWDTSAAQMARLVIAAMRGKAPATPGMRGPT